MKKINSIVLVIIILISMTACSSKTEKIELVEQNYEDLNEKESEMLEVEDAVDKEEISTYNYGYDISEQVNLVWYVIGTDAQDDELMIEEKLNEYLKDKINATVDIVFEDYSNYHIGLENALENDEKIDIMFTSSWVGTYNYSYCVENDIIISLEKYMQNEGILYETRELLGDHFLDATQVGGIYYGVPCNKEKAHNYGYLVRKDIVEELNLDISNVKTLDDMIELFEIVYESDIDILPLATESLENPMRMLDWNYLISTDLPLAIYADNSRTEVVNILEQDETKKYLMQMEKLYGDGYVELFVDMYGEIVSDGGAFAFTQSLKPGKDLEFSQGYDDDYLQIDITQPVISQNGALGSLTVITEKSENPDRAAMLIAMANTDKYVNNLLNFGVEDYHYSKIDDNMISLSEENLGYKPNIQWVFPNQINNYILETEDKNKYVNFQLFNAQAKSLDSLGFNFDSTGYEEIVDNVYKIYWEQRDIGLLMGKYDYDSNYDKLIKDLEDAGINELKDELQRQYDEWLKK